MRPAPRKKPPKRPTPAPRKVASAAQAPPPRHPAVLVSSSMQGGPSQGRHRPPPAHKSSTSPRAYAAVGARAGAQRGEAGGRAEGEGARGGGGEDTNSVLDQQHPDASQLSWKGLAKSREAVPQIPNETEKRAPVIGRRETKNNAVPPQSFAHLHDSIIEGDSSGSEIEFADEEGRQRLLTDILGVSEEEVSGEDLNGLLNAVLADEEEDEQQHHADEDEEERLRLKIEAWDAQLAAKEKRKERDVKKGKHQPTGDRTEARREEAARLEAEIALLEAQKEQEDKDKRVAQWEREESVAREQRRLEALRLEKEIAALEAEEARKAALVAKQEVQVLKRELGQIKAASSGPLLCSQCGLVNEEGALRCSNCYRKLRQLAKGVAKVPSATKVKAAPKSGALLSSTCSKCHSSSNRPEESARCLKCFAKLPPL